MLRWSVSRRRDTSLLILERRRPSVVAGPSATSALNLKASRRCEAHWKPSERWREGSRRNGGRYEFSSPPRFAALLLVLILPEREKETLRGDLVEEYNLVVASLGERRARRWYWEQMARSVAPLLWASFRRG